MANFNLEYIEKNKRLNSSYVHDPTWKNKIKEIQNLFSEVIDNLKAVVPEYTNYTECHGDSSLDTILDSRHRSPSRIRTPQRRPRTLSIKSTLSPLK